MQCKPAAILSMVALPLIAGCQSTGTSYLPGSPGVEVALAVDAVARAAGRQVETVSVAAEYGAAGFSDGPEVIGYDAWIRIAGCGGYLVVSYDRFGMHRRTDDRSRCS